MEIAIVLFVLGALFGLHILTNILKNQPTPKISVVIHGLLVATGLIVVVVAVAKGGTGTLVTSMVLFLLAALGGLTLLYIDIGKKQAPPKALAILHPILAAIGLILLIIYAAG
jgi:hypothetical protein